MYHVGDSLAAVASSQESAPEVGRAVAKFAIGPVNSKTYSELRPHVTAAGLVWLLTDEGRPMLSRLELEPETLLQATKGVFSVAEARDEVLMTDLRALSAGDPMPKGLEFVRKAASTAYLRKIVAENFTLPLAEWVRAASEPSHVVLELLLTLMTQEDCAVETLKDADATVLEKLLTSQTFKEGGSSDLESFLGYCKSVCGLVSYHPQGCILLAEHYPQLLKTRYWSLVHANIADPLGVMVLIDMLHECCRAELAAYFASDDVTFVEAAGFLQTLPQDDGIVVDSIFAPLLRLCCLWLGFSRDYPVPKRVISGSSEGLKAVARALKRSRDWPDVDRKCLYHECVGYVCVDFNPLGSAFFDRTIATAFQETLQGVESSNKLVLLSCLYAWRLICGAERGPVSVIAPEDRSTRLMNLASDGLATRVLTLLVTKPFDDVRQVAFQTMHVLLCFAGSAQKLVMSEPHRLLLLLPHPYSVAAARYALLQALLRLHPHVVAACADPRFEAQVRSMLANGPHFVCPELRSAAARVDFI